MATLGLSKVFILDKYFTELQKYWETEKKLLGKLRVMVIAKFHFDFGQNEFPLKNNLPHISSASYMVTIIMNKYFVEIG